MNSPNHPHSPLEQARQINEALRLNNFDYEITHLQDGVADSIIRSIDPDFFESSCSISLPELIEYYSNEQHPERMALKNLYLSQASRPLIFESIKELKEATSTYGFIFRALDLEIDEMSADDFSFLLYFEQLRHLIFYADFLSDDIGPYLAQLKKLTHLEILDCDDFTDNIWPHLAQLNNLTQLRLTECENFTDEIGPYLAQLKKLTHLELKACKNISDVIGPYLIQLKNLTQLDISSCERLTDEIGPYLAQLEKITVLKLVRSVNLTDDIGIHLVQLKNLTELDLCWCHSITSGIGQHLAEIKSLTFLWLNRNKKISNQDLNTLSENLPYIVIFKRS